MRDCSSAINDGHAPPPGHPAAAPNGIDTDAPAYYSVAMAMGKRRRRAKQTSMWVATEDLPGVRSYISEPNRGRRNWKKDPGARDAVYRNRRRIRGAS